MEYICCCSDTHLSADLYSCWLSHKLMVNVQAVVFIHCPVFTACIFHIYIYIYIYIYLWTFCSLFVTITNLHVNSRHYEILSWMSTVHVSLSRMSVTKLHVMGEIKLTLLLCQSTRLWRCRADWSTVPTIQDIYMRKGQLSASCPDHLTQGNAPNACCIGGWARYKRYFRQKYLPMPRIKLYCVVQGQLLYWLNSVPYILNFFKTYIFHICGI